MQKFEAMELARENGIEPARAHILTDSVYRMVIRVMRENGWCAQTGSGALKAFVGEELESRGMRPVLSDGEAMVSEYLFEKLTQAGWHALA
jgi:hypothetical protein